MFETLILAKNIGFDAFLAFGDALNAWQIYFSLSETIAKAEGM